jgi:hypothetical protein
MLSRASPFRPLRSAGHAISPDPRMETERHSIFRIRLDVLHPLES